MTRHGPLYLRDQVPPRSTHHARGKFGRLFPSRPPFARDNPAVGERRRELGRAGGLMDAQDLRPRPTR